jgi:toxin-antitoxin system PIN domain toxin
MMVLPDVNILVYAFREDAADHGNFKSWLDEVINSDEAYGIADLVLSGFLRIVTNPRAFSVPTPMAEALIFVERLRNVRNCVVIAPGSRHWEIFRGLCETGGIRGNLVPDAYFAALAIESGSEWITTDGDYARFRGLRWRRPFELV